VVGEGVAIEVGGGVLEGWGGVAGPPYAVGENRQKCSGERGILKYSEALKKEEEGGENVYGRIAKRIKKSHSKGSVT